MELFNMIENVGNQNIGVNAYKKDTLAENNYMYDILEIEDFCKKIEKDARRYNRYLGNDTKAVLI